ncbi:hypothetical protein QTH90_29930 [Variovorax sp. J2P1-59]|uniref:hypothetical protein n=1 Tax=Variovorax flavidus TaxID=3053501 RepID=UPI002578869E|nr:hypothetical protein [Variovorax sp. J2P1-59]MDM0078660.1 hypothetical protein [Variovorax sp. J2P1-59]
MKDNPDTNLGWWTEKPEREIRSSSSVPIRDPAPRREERVWVKVALIATIMIVFAVSLLRLFGAIV